MNKATAEIYFDKLRPRKDGKCTVKIKITHNRKRKYISTGINLTPDAFEKVMHGKRKTLKQRQTYDTLIHQLDKAKQVINDLKVFTFDSFENTYFENRNIADSVSFAFDDYTEGLRNEKRISTAVSYK
ncbi:MAG: Arm DNA-binding domain-containing protein, partial [Bacteroidota bacterium]|nr:Arm DNA-binding domain-containing protein [Bacteroidota bacterium]